MKKSIFIQLKAAFLLVVFSLNTMSGFACAVGMDMEFGSLHKPGSARDQAPVAQKGQSCHKEPHQPGKEVQRKADNNSRDCCGDRMIRFDKLDKTLVKSLTIVNPVFLNVFVSTFFDVDTTFSSRVATNIEYFDRTQHLPIPDIRVIIRSFQV